MVDAAYAAKRGMRAEGIGSECLFAFSLAH